jgi:hypothetical protein
LAGENLQNFAFKALIAQRHPSQVMLIEDVVSRPPMLCHDNLSRPRFGFFSCAAVSSAWSSESRVNLGRRDRDRGASVRSDGE